MKVLVTGGAGFIGSHIVDELLQANYTVVVVDNFSSGKREHVNDEATLYIGDLHDSLDHIFELEKPDYVIHLAAQVSVSQSLLNPINDAEQNIVGTIQLLKTCVKYGVKKIIFSSTAAVYGETNYLPIDESHELNPVSFYGLSKLQAEAYIQLFATLYGLDFTILRFANVYGMRQTTEGEAGVISIFIDDLLTGKSPTIFGDGLQSRDFIFVKDVAKANVAAIKNGRNEIMNISTSNSTPVLTVAKELSKRMGEHVPLVFANKKIGDIAHSYLCNEKAQRVLDWKPQVQLAAGLSETIQYYEEQINDADDPTEVEMNEGNYYIRVWKG